MPSSSLRRRMARASPPALPTTNAAGDCANSASSRPWLSVEGDRVLRYRAGIHVRCCACRRTGAACAGRLPGLVRPDQPLVAENRRKPPKTAENRIRLHFHWLAALGRQQPFRPESRPASGRRVGRPSLWPLPLGRALRRRSGANGADGPKAGGQMPGARKVARSPQASGSGGFRLPPRVKDPSPCGLRMTRLGSRRSRRATR